MPPDPLAAGASGARVPLPTPAYFILATALIYRGKTKNMLFSGLGRSILGRIVPSSFDLRHIYSQYEPPDRQIYIYVKFLDSNPPIHITFYLSGK